MRLSLNHDHYPELHLRPLQQADAPALHGAVTLPRIGRMLHGFPAGWTLQQARSLIARLASRVDWPCFALDAGDGRFLGLVGLSERDPEQLTFFLVPVAEGKGLMRVALAGFVTYVFAQRDLPAIRAEVYHDNAASMALLLGLGFVETGQRDGSCSPLRCGAERLYQLCLPRGQEPRPASPDRPC